MFKLVISDDEGKTTTVPLVRDEITIGRKEGNTIRLTERNVSRRHARLQKQNGHYLIQDLGSYNGVVINGGRLADPRALKHGDQIIIGDYKLAIIEEGTTQAAVPPPPDPASEARVPSVPPSPSPHSTAPAIPSAMGTLQGVSSPPASPEPTPGYSSIPPQASPSVPPAGVSEAPPEVRGLRLVFLSPAGAPAPVTLERLPLILGRSEAADIMLPFSSISREHARISHQDGKLVIEDLGSSNGVVVNGQKVSRSIISAGDLVTLGVVEFRVAQRGDSTVILPPEAVPARRSGKRPVVAGIVGGGAILAVLGFVLARQSAAPTTAAPSAVPAAPAQPPPALAQASAPPAVAPPAPPSGTQAALAPSPAAPQVTPPVPAAVAPAVQLNSAPVQQPAQELTVAQNALPHHASRGAHERPRTSTGNIATPAPAPAPAPVVSAQRPAPAPAPSPQPAQTNHPVAAAPSPSAATGMSAARGCSGPERNQCIVDALRRPTTEDEFMLLIGTLRQMSRRDEAMRHMRTYLNRYPNGRRAQEYRDFLDAQ